MQRIQLLGSTVALTLLIWFSADQLVTQTQDIEVEITVQPAQGSSVVVSSDPHSTNVIYRVTVRGRNKDVAALTERGRHRVRITVKDADVEGQPLGPWNLELRQALPAASYFDSVTVDQVDPPTIPLLLDRLTRIEVPVQVRPGNLLYSVDPRVEPATVDVTILQTLADKIEGLNPRVTLDGETYLRNQPEETPVKLEGLRLETKLDTDAQAVPVIDFDPDTVTLRATLRKRLKTATLQAVPIKYLVSASLWGRYDLEFRIPNPNETISIRVVGPAEEIDRLTSGDRKVFGAIKLGTPDARADAPFQFYTPEFDLPRGVSLADDQTIESLEIRLVPRSESAHEAAPTG